MFLLGRHLLSPSFPSAPHSATQHAPVHRTSHRHINRLDLPLIRGYSRSEGPGVKGHSEQEKSRKHPWGAHCFLLQVMEQSSGTVIPGFRWAVEDALQQGYHRLVPRPTDVKGSLSTDSSGPCPLLGWAASSRGAWR